MKIRMLRTLKGSPDGLEVREYEAGRKYDVPERLAGNFLGQGAAEEDKELVLETKSKPQGGVPADQGIKKGKGKGK